MEPNSMKDNLVEQFLALQEALLKEKERLEARLEVIDRALQSTRPAPKPANGESGQTRRRNKESLRDLVPQVTAKAPLSKKEILEARQNRGYSFSTSNPVASLNTFLYTNKGLFKNINGRFSPVNSKIVPKRRPGRKSRKPATA